MYITMKITALFLTLMWVQFALSASKDLKLVYMNGSAFQVHTKTLCYQEPYNVDCGKDWFAPIRNMFSLKEPAFSSANNCTGQNAYPKQCCKVDPTDCNFTSIKDFDQIRQVCSGRTHCTGQRAPWHPVYESRPNMHCPYQQGLTNVLTTQYVTTEYMCVPQQSIQRMCGKGTKQGQGLFLSSKDYPAYYPQSTGFNCSCQVVFGNSGNSVLKVAAIDLRLCPSSSRCGRTLSIGDAPPISVTSTTEEDPSLVDSIPGIVGMKEIYSATSTTGHITMELTDVDSKEELYLWLYLYSEGSDMTVTCNAETTFTTPTTTTTTTTTTTPTTSTTPTTPTRSTTPTTTPNLTTPVTTTPSTTSTTTTANVATKHQTPTSVAPNTLETNIGCHYDQLCNCEHVTALSQKLYYIELAASALGGIVFTAICWCTYSMWHKHKKAKKAKALRRRKVSSDQFAMYGGRKNYLNNDTRSVYSIEPSDSASQVGIAKPRKVNHHNRNQQAARQAQKVTQRGGNQGVPRKISFPYDVPNEYDEIEEGSTKVKDEDVQSKDEIVNKLADRINTHPMIEKVIRQQAKERINCHYETDINEDTDIKIILGGFGLEILKNTLSEMESQDQSHSF